MAVDDVALRCPEEGKQRHIPPLFFCCFLIVVIVVTVLKASEETEVWRLKRAGFHVMLEMRRGPVSASRLVGKYEICLAPLPA